ncbi:MAG: hypothetical protein EA376_09195 [Phycisphaeraceae bacterium]|nr:MAG: hypothetical protein EA376_09195 [Phycisphaeraceae bacterium]
MSKNAHRSTRLVFGFMTGTSLDGLDGAAVRIEGRGLDMRCALETSVSLPLDACEPILRALAEGRALMGAEIAAGALGLGELHAEAVRRLIDQSGPPDLVALHGQTVFHSPPLSWQLVNPWPVAKAAGCPVVHDFRGSDLAAGGQGAPITPIADWILFRSKEKSRAVVNLGGYCNITMLPAGAGPEDIRAFDVCACNQLLDAVARRALDTPYDASGARAGAGEAHTGALDDLLKLLDAQRRSGRSLGTGDESGGWIDAWIDRLGPEDLAATAARGVGETIARAAAGADETIVAGGGARNLALVGAIGESVRTTDDIADIPVNLREAACMAVLGALCADGVPITLPNVTGAAPPAPIAGAWAGLDRSKTNA